KLSIPLVRPEDERTFKSLYITSGTPDHRKQDSQTVETAPSTVSEAPSIHEASTSASAGQQATSSRAMNGSTTAVESDDVASTGRRSLEQRPFLGLVTTRPDSKDGNEPSPAPGSVSRSGTSPAIWSNWRREGDKASTMDWVNASKN